MSIIMEGEKQSLGKLEDLDIIQVSPDLMI